MTFRTSRNIRTLMSINWNGFCYVSLCHKTKRPNLQFPDGCKYTLKLTLELMWLTSHMTLVTQPMLQCWPNWTKLRLMDSIFKFYVDSKNVSQKFLHSHSWKNVFFFSKPTLGDQRKKSEKKDFFRSDGGGTFRLHFWNLH